MQIFPLILRDWKIYITIFFNVTAPTYRGINVTPNVCAYPAGGKKKKEIISLAEDKFVLLRGFARVLVFAFAFTDKPRFSSRSNLTAAGPDKGLSL